MFRYLLIALVAPVCFANPPKHHNAKPAPVAVAVADADASARANSYSNSTAKGGNATATGGEGGNSDATSNSGGNELSVNENHPKQAPGLAQGSFAIVGCGFAANAGGSGPGGAGFLGLGFTPEQCYDFMLANAYCTAGATQACCEVLNSSKAGRRAAARGVTLPVCAPPTHDPPAPPPPPVIVQIPCCDKPPPPPDCPPPDNRCYEKCERGCKAQCQGDAACEKRCEVTCKRRCDGVPPNPAGSAGGSCPSPGDQSKPN